MLKIATHGILDLYPTTKKAQPRERFTNQEGLQQPQPESNQLKKLTIVWEPSSINNSISNEKEKKKSKYKLTVVLSLWFGTINLYYL